MTAVNRHAAQGRELRKRQSAGLRCPRCGLRASGLRVVRGVSIIADCVAAPARRLFVAALEHGCATTVLTIAGRNEPDS